MAAEIIPAQQPNAAAKAEFLKQEEEEE